MIGTITKSVKITSEGKVYLLERGDKIKIMSGGKAKGMTIEDIANKHNVDPEFLEKQLKVGTKIELEHTNDKKLAASVAKDHLVEIPDYYVRLKKMEKEAGIKEEKQTITEASVHRRYLKVSHNGNDRYFSPSSANDNYMIRFLERLFNSKKFNNGSHKAKIVRKIPSGHKKMSLETFLKELIPVPEGDKK